MNDSHKTEKRQEREIWYSLLVEASADGDWPTQLCYDKDDVDALCTTDISKVRELKANLQSLYPDATYTIVQLVPVE